MGNEKVQAAARATGHVQAMVEMAQDYLRTQRAVNALGVYMVPEDVESRISCAIAILTDAQSALKVAYMNWPTEADQTDC